ncbi:MAG: septum formation protein Maf [Oscillospiraceae bacterium]|nr:septum formation protein Maf [Oscillospiraceae bacterium]
MNLILASQSPRRRELLEKIGVPFDIVVSECDETLPPDTPADQAAELLAVRKAAAVAKQHPDAVVIGADTTVRLLDGTILGKPKNYVDCVSMLHKLADGWHVVQTGVAIFWQGHSASFSEDTWVQFSAMTDAEIEAYASTEEPYDKAGAYGIQGHAALFIPQIDGDYYNVMGLPVAKLYHYLKKFGIIG